MNALVTGASRGIGKGVAISLAKQGYDLYITGRTEKDLHKVKNEIIQIGKKCTILVGDHSDLLSTVQLFQSIENIPFDIIVNNAWGGYEKMVENQQFTWTNKFWNQPDHRWVSMIDVGVRTAFICSRHCVKKMIERKNGLIVNISFWAAQQYMQNVIYGVSKAAIDKMTNDMAEELRPFNITIISLYPGLVRTESVLENAEYFNLENSESPEFEGLVIGALNNDKNKLNKSGSFYTSAGLANEYSIFDIDGKKIKEERPE